MPTPSTGTPWLRLSVTLRAAVEGPADDAARVDVADVDDLVAPVYILATRLLRMRGVVHRIMHMVNRVNAPWKVDLEHRR